MTERGEGRGVPAPFSWGKGRTFTVSGGELTLQDSGTGGRVESIGGWGVGVNVTGGAGELWSWAVEKGLMDEDGDGGEIVAVALLRAILTRYAEALGGNAVAAEELTTLSGGDADVVDSCRAVLDEFFGG